MTLLGVSLSDKFNNVRIYLTLYIYFYSVTMPCGYPVILKTTQSSVPMREKKMYEEMLSNVGVVLFYIQSSGSISLKS